MSTLLQAFEAIVETIGDGEVTTDYDGMPYATIPVGYQQAIEIEYNTEAGGYQLWFRAWDRTNGLSAEDELGLTENEHEAAHKARELIDQHARSEAELEAQLSPLRQLHYQYLEEE